MASSSQILREYLVSLGFKVNNDSQRVFDSTLGKTNLNVMALGKTVLGVVTATQAMVYLFSKSMEQMYYSSRRAETTVGNLKALDFAARNIGLGGDQMRGALEGMARAMRLNPGLQGLVESFGIKVTGRDKADVAVDLVDALRKMPFYIGSQYAGLFGIDPDTFLLLSEGIDKLKEGAAARKAMAEAAGVDADEAARASLEYMRLFRNITERVGLLKDAVAIALLPSATKFLELLDEGITKVTRMVSEANKQSKPMDTDLQKLGGGSVLGGYWAILDKFREGAWNWIKTGSPHMNGPRSVSGVVGGSGTDGQGQLPIGLRQNNPGNLRSWGSAPVANGFAQFGTSAEGLSAMAGNLLAYSRRGLNSVEAIIKRWAPASENNTGAYISSVANRLGVGAGDALDLKNPDVLAALMGAITHHENGRNPFSMDELRQAANSRLGSVQIQQKTDIHVHGAGGDATAKAVAREQSGVNAELASVVRNQVGALQ